MSIEFDVQPSTLVDGVYILTPSISKDSTHICSVEEVSNSILRLRNFPQRLNLLYWTEASNVPLVWKSSSFPSDHFTVIV